MKHNLKHIIFLHFLTTFCNFVLKMGFGWATGAVNPFWELQTSMMYVCLNVCFYCCKVLIWSFTTQWSLNFNCVLLTMKLYQVLTFWYHNPLGCLFPYNLHFLEKSLSQYPEARWIILHGFNFSCIIFTHWDKMISVHLRWHMKCNILARSWIFKKF